eukprot:3759506-Prymnesium_polylepis.1
MRARRNKRSNSSAESLVVVPVPCCTCACTFGSPGAGASCSACDIWRRNRIRFCAGAFQTDERYDSCVSDFCSSSRGTARTSTSDLQTTVVSWRSPRIASYPNWSPGPSVPSRAFSPVEEMKFDSRWPDATM